MSSIPKGRTITKPKILAKFLFLQMCCEHGVRSPAHSFPCVPFENGLFPVFIRERGHKAHVWTTDDSGKCAETPASHPCTRHIFRLLPVHTVSRSGYSGRSGQYEARWRGGKTARVPKAAISRIFAFFLRQNAQVTSGLEQCFFDVGTRSI